MIACVDVDYRGDEAIAACVAAGAWEDASPIEERWSRGPIRAPYVPGELYRRELPPILGVLALLSARPEAVVVDGYAWLGEGRPGLGAHLHRALGVPVVGVAKRPFASAPASEVLRGTSRRPLYVTAAGLDAARAASLVRAMAGANRIPTLLARADRLARSAGR